MSSVGCNEENCNCPKTECSNHGKCCQCIMHHRKSEIGSIVYCLRAKAAEVAAAEKKG